MQFPILLLLLLLIAITLIGIIPAIAVQIIPVGGPPRPSTTLVLQATEFLMVVIMVYGPKLSGKIQVLKMKEDLTAQIRVSTSVHPGKAMLSSQTAQVPAGILLPVSCTASTVLCTTVLWIKSSPAVTVGPVHRMTSRPPMCWVLAAVTPSYLRSKTSVHTAVQSAARESPIDGQDALSPGTGR